MRVGGILSDQFGANGMRILEGLVAGAEREEILASLSRHVHSHFEALHDAMGGCPRVRGNDVGTGKDLNVSCATADLDPPADERERHGVGPSLERDPAIRADAARDGDVEGLWHRLGKRTEVRALSLPSTEHLSSGGRTVSRNASRSRRAPPTQTSGHDAQSAWA